MALASLVSTYLFFFEYIPPVRWVHIPYDLEEFHYPLADYAFQSLRQGRFPLWDPTIYCGMSFVANVQAALFYPPTWLMFLLSLGRERLSYQAMEDVLLAHVWLGFLLCYLWLRGKRLRELPCVLGAGVFAFSGYMCTQLQHFGLVGGYCWIPLALWGVDQSVEQRSWRPLWKVAAASALCLLAGYPPTWMVFAMVVGVYSVAGAWRWKAAVGTIAALVFSLLVCSVQILPTWEINALREPEVHYIPNIRNPDMILSFVLPNYFNFGLNMPVATNPEKDYFYLGVPALLGVPFLIRRRRFKDLLPSLAVLAVSLLMMVNPFDSIWILIRHSTLLSDVLRSWYFLAGVTVAFAPLTAYALDHFLERKASAPRWLPTVCAALMALWGGYEIFQWRTQRLAAGWGSALDVLITLAIFGAAMHAVRGAQGRERVWISAAVLLFVGADYKAYGTSKRFDASKDDPPRFATTSYTGMPPDVYQQLRAHSNYRILFDAVAGSVPQDFRHIGLMTPQGSDPYLTTAFRKLVEADGHFTTDRLFDIDPENYDAMKLFGVRYVISSEYGKSFSKLKDDPRYRPLGSTATYYRVFEYSDARPPYSWDGSIAARTWEPERRVFAVSSAAGGQLALHEQFFPGWTAMIDGKAAPDQPWMGAFQAVTVPAGDHTVEFRYRSRLLGVGGAISIVALVGLGFWILASLRSKFDTEYPAVSG